MLNARMLTDSINLHAEPVLKACVGGRGALVSCCCKLSGFRTTRLSRAMFHLASSLGVIARSPAAKTQPSDSPGPGRTGPSA